MVVTKDFRTFATTIFVEHFKDNAMEQLLHYVWKHRMFPLKELETTDGKYVEVIDPGLHNHNAGPDFFNAKVNIRFRVQLIDHLHRREHGVVRYPRRFSDHLDVNP